MNTSPKEIMGEREQRAGTYANLSIKSFMGRAIGHPFMLLKKQFLL